LNSSLLPNSTLAIRENNFIMDYLNKFTGGGGNQGQGQQGQQKQESGGFMDNINSAAGGGRQSEQKEDMLDKGRALCDSSWLFGFSFLLKMADVHVWRYRH
jgi:hypothetical protein